MAELSASFNELFRKYRLKAEIPTLSEFGHLLAEKGFNYEDSIFSHWQNGTRIPQYRNILIKLIEIFAERRAITTVGEANQLLASANQGYLSEKELAKIPLKFASQVFQVPSEVSNFSGREGIIEKLIFKTDIAGKVVVIHGPAGVGKTALAIKLGHLLRDKYKDGVFWYKIEEDNIMDILLSIAKVLGEDISGINDLQVRGTVVRSLLASKNILLFLDSAELYSDIHLLIPNSQFCTTIITSQKASIKSPIEILDIKLDAFTNDEALKLFKDVLKERYAKINKKNLLKIAKGVGNLPLAVGLIARSLQHRNFLVQEEVLLDNLYQDNHSLKSAISVSYDKLTVQNKSVLVSASIFKGKDFSSESVAYINGLTKGTTIGILENLTSLSLIEHSTKNRFRIHPAIKDLIREKLDYPRSRYLTFIAVLIFIILAGWWAFLQLFVDKNNFQFHSYGITYPLMALYGGICGINTSLNWGGLKTLLGRSILFFSLGLFAQVFGQIVYGYYAYIIHHTAVAYPSIGDLGFFGTIPLYGYGAILLVQSSGIKIRAESFRKKMIALIIPIVMLAIGYILFLHNYEFDWNKPIKIFLDFGQPLGNAMVISIALIIFIFSRNILDGIMRSKALLVLIALFAQFLADYLFMYDLENFYTGNYIDFSYLSAYFIMTLALLSFKSIQIKVY